MAARHPVRALCAVAAALAFASPIAAQDRARPAGGQADSMIEGAPQALRVARPFSWFKFVAGVVTSLAAHELAHLVTSFVVDGDPSVGFDDGRPVVHSGIDASRHPNRQFAFSASGMAVQLLINEVILDWPRAHRGIAGEFERGVLAGGIGTVLFYFTVGRSSAVSDVTWMAETSGLSKWTLTAIFGGVAALDVLRIAVDQRYAHFFAFPDGTGTLHFGVTIGG